VSLLAMSFTFGLAVFGGALAAGLHAYLTASAWEARDIRTRIALESAAATVLGGLAAGGPVTAEIETASDGSGQRVSIMVPASRADLAEDAPETIAAAAKAVGLVLDPSFTSRARGLAEVSAHHRLSAPQEDCLRQAFTYGRGGAPMMTARGLEGARLRAGDQVDLRIQAADPARTVLWMRARFTGSETGWQVHDHRLLRGVTACPRARAARPG